jgi:hypothetical protein
MYSRLHHVLDDRLDQMLTAGGTLEWLVTGWFAILGAVSLLAAVRQSEWPARVSLATHVLMCAAMAAMPWPTIVSIPAIAWILVFSACALWYLGLTNFGFSRFAAPNAGHAPPPITAVHHATMMAAMVWVAVLRASQESARADAMPGMDMSGMDMSGMEMAGSGTQSTTGLPYGSVGSGWVLAPTLGLAAVCGIASIWFVVELVRLAPPTDTPRELSPVIELLLNLGMALGMGGSLLAIA